MLQAYQDYLFPHQKPAAQNLDPHELHAKKEGQPNGNPSYIINMK